jgi:hypothetical protein
MTLISADNDFALMAMLFVIAGGAFLAERTKVGSHLTGAVIAILAAIAAANMRIIPHSAPAFDFVFSYFVPVLIPLFLFKANLRHMIFETTRMTIAFLIASVGTIVGVIIAVGLLDLGSLAPAAEIDPALREAGIAGLFATGLEMARWEIHQPCARGKTGGKAVTRKDFRNQPDLGFGRRNQLRRNWRCDNQRH